MSAHRTVAVFVLAVGALSVTACATYREPGPGPGPEPEVVRAPDGAYVEVPAGALPAGTSVTVRVLPAAGGPAARPFTRAGKIYELSPHGVAFDGPVTVHIPFDGRVSAGDVGFYTAEEGETTWHRLDARVDEDERMVVAEMSHFSFVTPGGVDCATTCSNPHPLVVTTCADGYDPGYASNPGLACNPAYLPAGSLREALCKATDCDTVTFDLPGACAIAISGPPITSSHTITIDGNPALNGGAPGRTTVTGAGLAYQGPSSGYPAVLTIDGDGSTVRNLVLAGGPGDGLVVQGACERIEEDVVSGNSGGGINGSMSRSWIRANFIGVEADGTTSWPNGDVGLQFGGGSSDTLVGGPSVADPNVIAYNEGGSGGVNLHDPTCQGIVISRNSITQNGQIVNGLVVGQGITLTSGANGGITAPTITARAPNILGGATTAPDGSRVEIFADPVGPGYQGGQGQKYLCTVDASANAFTAVAGANGCPASFPAGGSITATVTSPSPGNDTSPFSGIVECIQPLPVCGNGPPTGVDYQAATLPESDPAAPWLRFDFGHFGDTNADAASGGVLTFTGGDVNSGNLLDNRGLAYFREEPAGATSPYIEYSATFRISMTNAVWSGMDGIEATSYATLLMADGSRMAALTFAILDGQSVISVQGIVPDNHPSLGDPTVYPIDWTQPHTYAFQWTRCVGVDILVDGATVFSIPYIDLGSDFFGSPVFAFLSGTCESEWTQVEYTMCGTMLVTPTCTTIQRGTSGAVADATIAEDTQHPALADTNAGADDLLWAGDTSSTANQESLLRFDLSGLPANATVTSAALTFRSPQSAPGQALGPGYVRVHLATAPWSEGNVTWNSFGGAFDPAVQAQFDGVHMPTSVLLPNAVVQSWLDAPATNDGILMEQTVPQSIAFRSSEHAAVNDRPSLTVCYTH